MGKRLRSARPPARFPPCSPSTRAANSSTIAVTMSPVAIKPRRAPRISAIDLFCGAGGLSYGLQQAGISVDAGIDLDPACEYPIEFNIDASFLEMDIRDVSADHLKRLWQKGSVRLLAGCA